MNIYNGINFRNFLATKVFFSRDYTSNFVYSTELEHQINNNQNILLLDEDNWLLLVNKLDFYVLYYSLKIDEIESLTNKFKASFSSLIESSGIREVSCEYLSKNESDELIDNFLESLSFKFLVKRERLTLKSYESCKTVSKSNDFEIEFAEPELATSILKMYQDSFDKYTSLMPELDELKNILGQNLILALKRKTDNDLAAVLEFTRDKNLSMLNHLVVNRSYRRLGLGKYLVSSYIEEIVLKENLKARLWVQRNNEAANKIYKGLGYVPDGLYSTAYLFKAR
jgi:ribosomal protein S18 acetylase RimI-like enzyme